MRRDTQIGVILGVVIIGIIAVFLSTRTEIKSPQSIDLANKDESNNEKEIEIEFTTDIFENDAFVEETLESDIDDLAINREKQEVNIEEPEIIDNEDSSVIQKDEEKVAEKQIVIDSPFETEEKKEVEKELDKKIAKNEKAEHAVIKKEKRVLTHKVEPSDNLFSMAKKYYGDPKKWLKIYNANSDVIYDRNSLPLGKELIIPDVEILNVKKGVEIANNDYSEKSTKLLIDKKVSGKRHLVKRGDTLFALARSYYGDSNNWELIYNANRNVIGSNKQLISGLYIKIPQEGILSGNEKNKLYTLQSQTNVDKTSNNKPGAKKYKIKKGDTLYKIAEKHYKNGNKWKKIYDANRDVLTNSNSIPANVTIIIP